MVALLSSNISVSPVHSPGVHSVHRASVSTAHCDSDLVSSARQCQSRYLPRTEYTSPRHLGMIMCLAFIVAFNVLFKPRLDYDKSHFYFQASLIKRQLKVSCTLN